jgi:hypothetical protein
MKTNNEGVAPRIFNFGTIHRWVVSFMLRLHYPRYPLDRRLGGLQSRLDAVAKRKIPAPSGKISAVVQPVHCHDNLHFPPLWILRTKCMSYTHTSVRLYISELLDRLEIISCWKSKLKLVEPILLWFVLAQCSNRYLSNAFKRQLVAQKKVNTDHFSMKFFKYMICLIEGLRRADHPSKESCQMSKLIHNFRSNSELEQATRPNP